MPSYEHYKYPRSYRFKVYGNFLVAAGSQTIPRCYHCFNKSLRSNNNRPYAIEIAMSKDGWKLGLWIVDPLALEELLCCRAPGRGDPEPDPKGVRLSRRARKKRKAVGAGRSETGDDRRRYCLWPSGVRRTVPSQRGERLRAAKVKKKTQKTQAASSRRAPEEALTIPRNSTDTRLIMTMSSAVVTSGSCASHQSSNCCRCLGPVTSSVYPVDLARSNARPSTRLY